MCVFVTMCRWVESVCHSNSFVWSACVCLSQCGSNDVMIRNPVCIQENMAVLVDFDTSLPSNLRPTTCECMHLVMRGHIIRSAIAENPMLHANFMALCFIEQELIAERSFTLRELWFSNFFACVVLTSTLAQSNGILALVIIMFLPLCSLLSSCCIDAVNCVTSVTLVCNDFVQDILHTSTQQRNLVSL